MGSSQSKINTRNKLTGKETNHSKVFENKKMDERKTFRAPRKVAKSSSNASSMIFPTPKFETSFVTPMLGRKSELWRGSVGKSNYDFTIVILNFHF